MWVANLFKIIKSNGGWKNSFLVLLQTDSLKFGKYVGKDPFGNKYYENPFYFFETNKWVIYSDRFGFDYDATHIHSSWFRWMHHMTDLTPMEEGRERYHWMLEHTENATGTKDEYVPYSTTKPKITHWTPERKLCFSNN